MLERKKQTIRDMVQQMDCVQKAIVDYDEARGETPFADLQRTAIVTVKPVGSRTLDSTEVRAIRDTVRGAVAGLMARDITVIDINANRSWVGETGLLSLPSAPHVTARLQEERNYENKIRSALTSYPGVRVNVEVTIDPVLRRLRDQRTVDADPVSVSRTTQSESVRPLPAAGPTTEPGEILNVGANGQGWAGGDTPPVETRRETEVTKSVSSGTFESTESAGLTVTSVNVSIGVPEHCIEYFVQRERQRRNAPRKAGDDSAPASSTDEIADEVFDLIRDDIRKKVSPLLPADLSAAAEANNIVVTVDRNIPIESDSPPRGTLTSAKSPFPWTTATLVALGLLVFVWFRPVLSERNHLRAVVAEIERRSGLNRQALRVADGTETGSRGPRDASAPTQETIQRQLDEWCQANPGAAAHTIRQWLDRRAG
jgi:flagellar biosynthesis/type III secretory pathway M-ring protein FliF/YscJ